MIKNKNLKKGFTLVEIMVSISVFSLVLLISMGSILSVLDANRKSQALRAVMDNLNFSLESMTRDIRFGENYHCGNGGILSTPNDCQSGDSSLNLKLSDSSEVTYQLSGNRIVKNVGGINYYITSQDVSITNLKFYVLGSAPLSSLDLRQPKIIIIISGYTGSKPTVKTSFVLETTVSQRKLDYN